MPDPPPPHDSDARHVDAWLDEQATGPDIYDPDHVPPPRPQWRDITKWEDPLCPTTTTPAPPA